MATAQADLHSSRWPGCPRGRKSASGFLVLVGGIFAGGQALIVTGAILMH